MRINTIFAVVFIGCTLFAANGFCEHYVNGTEGVKCASPPPPGFYDKIYTAYYTASQINDENGNEISILDPEISVIAHVHRFVYISKDKKLMGGNLGAELIVPIQKINTEIMGEETDEFGFGDIITGPLLFWYSDRYEVGGALDFFLPTGNEDNGLGHGHYTFMPTFGGTYYFDPNKKITGSILARYEIHTERDDDVTPGNDFHFEFGFGYSPKQFMDIGIGGYYQKQVAEDDGPSAITSDIKDTVIAVGPQIIQLFPQKKWGYSFNIFKEFGAEDRPEGLIACLSITLMIL